MRSFALLTAVVLLGFSVSQAFAAESGNCPRALEFTYSKPVSLHPKLASHLNDGTLQFRMTLTREDAWVPNGTKWVGMCWYQIAQPSPGQPFPFDKAFLWISDAPRFEVNGGFGTISFDVDGQNRPAYFDSSETLKSVTSQKITLNPDLKSHEVLMVAPGYEFGGEADPIPSAQAPAGSFGELSIEVLN